MTVAALPNATRANVVAALVTCAGCLALAARPPIVWVGFGVTVAVGVAGGLVPVPNERSRRPLIAGLVTLAGIAAFGSIRFMSAVPPMPGSPRVAFIVTGAAIAEEIFFRRFLYAALAQRGPVVAVGTTALLFGLVHIPAYGAGVFPLDLAAGLVLGWQRWASGTWMVPAVSHVAANLMIIL